MYPELRMSDDIYYTCRADVYGLFNFLKDDLDFRQMFVKCANDNPLSFTLIIVVDDLPAITTSTIATIFSDNRYKYFQNIALTIKARMIERDELAKSIEEECT